MKYRVLNDEELKHLEVELVQFLIVNGVHGEQWEALNKENPEKALKLVELFSDNVLQKVYDKIKVLEFRSNETCLVFYFDDSKIELISINRGVDSHVDLSTPEHIHDAMVNYPNHLSFFKTEKKYTTERSLEIHKMLEQGCVVSSMDFWNALLAVIS